MSTYTLRVDERNERDRDAGQPEWKPREARRPFFVLRSFGGLRFQVWTRVPACAPLLRCPQNELKSGGPFEQHKLNETPRLLRIPEVYP